MTAYLAHRCNLCNDFILPRDANAGKGYGVEWVNKKLTLRAVEDTERHVCLDCARGVHDAYRLFAPVAEGVTK